MKRIKPFNDAKGLNKAFSLYLKSKDFKKGLGGWYVYTGNVLVCCNLYRMKFSAYYRPEFFFWIRKLDSSIDPLKVVTRDYDFLVELDSWSEKHNLPRYGAGFDLKNEFEPSERASKFMQYMDGFFEEYLTFLADKRNIMELYKSEEQRVLWGVTFNPLRDIAGLIE